MTDRAERVWRWLVPLACLLPFLGFWTYGLFDLDEGFYAAVVVDMLRRGDWVTPTLNGVPWFEKPILAYWLAMPSVLAFGEWVGPRLPSVLCTLGTAAVLARFVRERFGLLAARLTALVFCGSLLVVGVGRLMMTDAPLVLCLTLALLGAYRLMERPEPDWPLAAGVGACLGLGVLAKGPVAGVLFIGSVVVFALVGRSRSAADRPRPQRFGEWGFGLVVCLAVLSVWYVPCYLANGQAFVQGFLIEQNVGRFAGGDRAHAVPWWLHPVFFPAVLALAVLPWLPWVARPVVGAVGALRGDPEGAWALRFLWAWGLVPLAFFTLSGSKLVHYVLPCMPALAALAGVALARRWSDGRALGWACAWCLLVAGLANAVFQLDWQNRMADVQRKAIWVRDRPEPLVVFRIGRGDEPMEIGTRLQDTSHPSVLFYVRRPAVQTETVAGALAAGDRFWMLKRAGRLAPDDIDALARAGYSDQTPAEAPRSARYELILWAKGPPPGNVRG